MLSLVLETLLIASEMALGAALWTYSSLQRSCSQQPPRSPGWQETLFLFRLSRSFCSLDSADKGNHVVPVFL